MRLLLAPVFFFVVTSLTAERAGSAIEQLQSCQGELQKSRAAKDWPSSLAAATKLKSLLNDNPTTLLEVARAEVHVGDLKAASAELQQFVRMGQASDLPLQSPEFAALRAEPEFATVQNGIEANRARISLASDAFLIPDSDLLAEDVDYDPHGHRFLVTSVRRKNIVAVDAGRPPTEFARSPTNWPMFAIKIDSPRNLVWTTEAAIQGFDLVPKSDWGRSAVLCYDLKSGKLLRRIEGPRGAALGDLVLTKDGTVIVSDGEGGGVYRVLAGSPTLERLDDGDFISPQTPAMHPDGKHVFVPDYERGVAVLDLTTKQVRWLRSAGQFALNGIDGLYFNRGRLIAVQNGTSPERVVAFTLNANLSEITSEAILERSTDTLGDPTHGVVVGNDFYYIANSGWNFIDDHGLVKPGAKPSEPHMMRVNLLKL